MNSKKDVAIYGVLGFPLYHSLSPLMHNAAFRAAGVNAIYKAFETQDPEFMIGNMDRLGISGFSVTIPYKSRVLSLLDELCNDAARIGAVNTIVNKGGRLKGFNTDGLGFLMALKKGGVSRPCNTLVLGAGGAARAIVYCLVSEGYTVTVSSRTEHKAATIARDFGCRFSPFEDLGKTEAALLVNTTPVGMAPHEDSCPIPPNFLKKHMTVFDIIYNPLRTRLVDLALKSGCHTIGGIDMFIFQGALQFRLWTGLEAPVKQMADAVMRALRDASIPTKPKE